MNEINKIKQIINSMVAKSPIGAMKISSTILLNKIESIRDKLEKEKQIELALQQMTGFRLGKWGASVRELVSSMGLTKKEWEYINKNEDSCQLFKEDIDEINEIFANGVEENDK